MAGGALSKRRPCDKGERDGNATEARFPTRRPIIPSIKIFSIIYIMRLMDRGNEGYQMLDSSSFDDASAAFSRLLAIMAKLRDPNGGCPWDLEQSFRTIVPHTIE